MAARHHQPERHGSQRGGWLRAAVLGANDGIVSTAALVVGVAAAGAGSNGVLVAGLAGLVGGAMSMATGEYVSVSSQADAEHADLHRERWELEQFPEGERTELAGIYQARGLPPELALQVADALTAHDALAAHARDELGIHELSRARPVQAALSSAGSFAVGAALPLALAVWLPEPVARLAVPAGSLLCLAMLGAWAAKVGGAPMLRGAARVVLWSALAMAFTWLVGRGVEGFVP